MFISNEIFDVILFETDRYVLKVLNLVTDMQHLRTSYYQNRTKNRTK